MSDTQNKLPPDLRELEDRLRKGIRRRPLDLFPDAALQAPVIGMKKIERGSRWLDVLVAMLLCGVIGFVALLILRPSQKSSIAEENGTNEKTPQPQPVPTPESERKKSVIPLADFFAHMSAHPEAMYKWIESRSSTEVISQAQVEHWIQSALQQVLPQARVEVDGKAKTVTITGQELDGARAAAMLRALITKTSSDAPVITAENRVIALDPKHLRKVLNGLEGPTGRPWALNTAQTQQLLSAIKEDSNSNILLAPKLILYSGQTGEISALQQQSYIADYDVVNDTFDPVIRTLNLGTKMSLFVLHQPLGPESKSIVLMRQSTQSLLDMITVVLERKVNKQTLSLPLQLPSLRMTENLVGMQVDSESTLVFCLLPDRDRQKLAEEKLPVVGSISDSILWLQTQLSETQRAEAEKTLTKSMKSSEPKAFLFVVRLRVNATPVEGHQDF